MSKSDKIWLVSNRGECMQAYCYYSTDKDGKQNVTFKVGREKYNGKYIDTPAFGYGVLNYNGQRWMSARAAVMLADRVEW